MPASATQRRTLGKRSKRLFVVSTEGFQTEPLYLNHFNPDDSEGDFRIRVLRDRRKNGLDDLFERLIVFRRGRPGPNTDYWMVFDKDRWTHDQIASICAKAAKAEINIALSNPCFEFWLYLHLAEPCPFATAQDCVQRLRQKLGTFEKNHFDIQRISAGLNHAIGRAEHLDDNPTMPWLRGQGSRMYRIMKELQRYGLRG